jgi:hypothetical protein
MDALRRVQPIDDVLAARSRLGGDGLAAAFKTDLKRWAFDVRFSLCAPKT